MTRRVLDRNTPRRRLCAVGSGMNAESLPKWPGMPWMVFCPECGKALDLNGGIYLPRHFTPKESPK